MLIGNGLIAQQLKGARCDTDEVVIFASGVSNSFETSSASFDREQSLLTAAIESSNHKNMLLIYFSSCALVDKKHLSIPYYQHKYNLEKLIYETANKFIIFRLPQLIGKSENKNTLVNYLVDKIKSGENFLLWSNATRYVIEVEDLKVILEKFVSDISIFNKTVDIANPYRYSILELVTTIANYLHKKANYNMIDKSDSYKLDLENFLILCKKHKIEIAFGKQYFADKLKKIV